MLHLAVLAGGVATFCVAMLAGAYPVCTWLEWAVAWRDADASHGAD